MHLHFVCISVYKYIYTPSQSSAIAPVSLILLFCIYNCSPPPCKVQESLLICIACCCWHVYVFLQGLFLYTGERYTYIFVLLQMPIAHFHAHLGNMLYAFTNIDDTSIFWLWLITETGTCHRWLTWKTLLNALAFTANDGNKCSVMNISRYLKCNGTQIFTM